MIRTNEGRNSGEESAFIAVDICLVILQLFRNKTLIDYSMVLKAELNIRSYPSLSTVNCTNPPSRNYVWNYLKLLEKKKTFLINLRLSNKWTLPLWEVFWWHKTFLGYNVESCNPFIYGAKIISQHGSSTKKGWMADFTFKWAN